MSATATAAPLRLRGLRKHYGPTRAVDGVELEVEAGSICALLGPSGCGKTTTLRLIAGLERPDEGEIAIGDRTLCGPGEFVSPERRRIGMVFQDYALFPHLDVAGNVGYGLGRKPDRERVGEVLELVGLDAEAEWWWCWRAWTGGRRDRCTSSPAASSSAWRSPARWRRHRS